MLEVKNLRASYGLLEVLHDVSFDVSEGEAVALVGSNGAGKTTTFRAISQIVRPTSGTIKFMGKQINGLSPNEVVKLGIVQVPEGRGLFPHMTVLENLELGAYLPKNRIKINESLEFVFDLFPILKERKKQLARTLSGGEQQMLAIARALMARPKLLMLDEVSLGLAPKLVCKIYESLSQLRRTSVTLLVVEQNVQLALNFCDRGYVMENGRIVLKGTGKELLESENIKKAYLW